MKLIDLSLELNYYTPPELIEWAARFSWLSHHLQTEKSHEEFLTHIMKMGHKSPLDCSLVAFSLHGVDRTVTHQLVRHGKSLGFSQESQRYVKQSQSDFYKHPVLTDFVYPDKFPMNIEDFYCLSRDIYVGLLKQGVDKEIARRVLPNAITSSMAIWGSVRGFLDFCMARMSPEAETPIRTIAASMFDTLCDIYPWIFKTEKGLQIRANVGELYPIAKSIKFYSEYRGFKHSKKGAKNDK